MCLLFSTDSATCRDLPIGGVSDVRGYRGRRKNKGTKRKVTSEAKGGRAEASIDQCTARILDRLDWAFVASSIDMASYNTTGLHLRDVRVSF